MLELDGLEDDDGVELEPVPAEPLVPLEELGLELEDDAPPLDWLFWLSDDEEGEELEGEAPEELEEPLIEPDGLEGVVAPLDEPLDEDGEVDEGLDEVVPVDEPLAPLLPRSQAVSRLAPSAMETATAIVESLM